MKVTKDNLNTIKYIYGYTDINKAINLLDSLLIDIDELNQILEDTSESYKKIYIDYENKHIEYSLERTDPCPDYYGMFTLRFEKNPYETIGDAMDLNDLDNAIYILFNFVEFKV